MKTRKVRAQTPLQVLASGGVLVVAVRAIPSDGAANRAVMAVLAEASGCPKSSLWLARGGSSREKWIGFRGLSCAQLQQKLENKWAQI